MTDRALERQAPGDQGGGLASITFEVPDEAAAASIIAATPGIQRLKDGWLGIDELDPTDTSLNRQLARLIDRWSTIGATAGSNAITSANLRVGLDGPGTGGFLLHASQLMALRSGCFDLDLFVDVYETILEMRLDDAGAPDELATRRDFGIVTPRSGGLQPAGDPAARWARTRISTDAGRGVGVVGGQDLLTRQGPAVHIDCPLQDDVHIDRQLEWAESVLGRMPVIEPGSSDSTELLTTTLGIDDGHGQYCFTVRAELIAELVRLGLAYALACPVPEIRPSPASGRSE